VFCDKSLTKDLQPDPRDLLSCNQYGAGNTTGSGYWGPFYEGQVNIAGNFELNANFSVVRHQVELPGCTNGLGGLFGIAFQQLDAAFHANDFEHIQPWSQDTVGQCPPFDQAVDVDLMPPLLGYLSSEGGIERLGIYWSGGQDPEAAGTLYLNEAVESNEFFSASLAHGPAKLGENGWYDMTIEMIRVGGKAWVTQQCKTPGNCILDTGNPWIMLPAEIIQQLLSGSETADEHLVFDLAGSDGSDSVSISLNATHLLLNGAIVESPDSSISLGLPLWCSYYTVFNITGGSMTFFSTTAREDCLDPWRAAAGQGNETSSKVIHGTSKMPGSSQAGTRRMSNTVLV